MVSLHSSLQPDASVEFLRSNEHLHPLSSVDSTPLLQAWQQILHHHQGQCCRDDWLNHRDPANLRDSAGDSLPSSPCRRCHHWSPCPSRSALAAASQHLHWCPSPATAPSDGAPAGASLHLFCPALCFDGGVPQNPNRIPVTRRVCLLPLAEGITEHVSFLDSMGLGI